MRILRGIAILYLLFLLLVILIADFKLQFQAIDALAWVSGKPAIYWIRWNYRLQSFALSDKVGHFLLLGMGSFWVNLALGCRTFSWRGRSFLWGSWLLLSVITLEECSQLWIRGRSFDFADMLSNGLGIWCFGWLALLLTQKVESWQQRHAERKQSLEGEAPHG